jgi:molybdopterin/thiamine biosynthesis adenylyltransferase
LLSQLQIIIFTHNNGRRTHQPIGKETLRQAEIHRMVNPTKVLTILSFRLLNSRVLITPANGPNTELAKNLILAGVNVTIYDDAIVNEDDFESNFLIA